ncbi:MAG: methyltransferase domain-containing protein [Myxococcales bacterium]
MNPSSPQAREMADESMVRNLAAQAEAIWPQERPIFERSHGRPERILDVGCGTGEITARLAELYPQAALTGIDLEESHLERARQRVPGARFEKADALALPYEAQSYDLAVCRHLTQAVPDASKLLKEIHRVLQPGGRAHVLSEDYGMLWCHPTSLDADGFWQRIPHLYGKAIGCDLYVGRKTYALMKDLGFRDIAVDYVVVDTLRVERETFARIWEAWRDGYTESIVERTGIPRAEIEQRWREMIGCVRDPGGYALWQIPVWTATR